MFAVVEYQQEVEAAKPFRQGLKRCLAGWPDDPEHRRHPLGSQHGLSQTREFDKPNAVLKQRRQIRCDPQGKSCFSDTARACECDETIGTDESPKGDDVAPAANEAR
jgi:hypothetical protein